MEDYEYEDTDRKFAETQERQVVTTNVDAPMALPAREFDGSTLDRAKQNVDISNKLKLLAIQCTNENDWINIGDKPYLTETGCQKFAGIYGVSFKDVQIDAKAVFNDEKGPVREYTANVTAVFQNRQDTEYGAASSADKFFERNGQRLPLSEICTANIMKKAVTNAKARAVKKILGLSFTWEEVNLSMKAGGKSTNNMASVSYGGKSGESNKSTGKGVMTKQKQEIGDMILDLAGGDKEAARNLLYDLTKFTKKDGTEFGVRSVADLSDKWAAKIYPKVKKRFDEEWMGNDSGEEASDA